MYRLSWWHYTYERDIGRYTYHSYKIVAHIKGFFIKRMKGNYGVVVKKVGETNE